MLTPEQRSLQARAAVLASWANTENRAARARPGGEALVRRLGSEDDRRAYFRALARRSWEVRRARQRKVRRAYRRS